MVFWMQAFYFRLEDIMWFIVWIAEKPDEGMAFYIQQPIKNAQHAKIKATKAIFFFQKNLRDLILFSFEPSMQRQNEQTH